jgi:hypothetical protein
MCADTDDPGEMIWPDTGCLTRCVVCDGNEWIEVNKIGAEGAPPTLASSASVSAVEQSATAHAAAPAGTEAPSP